MTKEISKNSYQELKEELDNIITQLQHESTEIDEAIKLHKNGQDILKKLEDYLEKAAKDADIK